MPMRRLVVALTGFSALSAIGGGVELVVFRNGNELLPPLEILEHTPFASFLVPGLALAVVVGGTNLACALLVWRNARAAIDAPLLAGGALMVFILAEVAMLRDVQWLHVVYGSLGAAIFGLGVRARVEKPARGYTVVIPSLDRQLAMDAFAALPAGHPMVAMLELDVTRALAAIAERRSRGDRVSLFAFVVRSIAVAIAENLDLNLVRHGKRLIRFEDVDVSVPVEVRTNDGRAPREIVIRQAQDKSALQIFAELEGARARHEELGAASDEDRWARRTMRAIRWLPSFARVALMRLVIRSAFRVKARAGTTLVTSVGKFASIPGGAFTFSTGPRAALFVVGSVVEKPWAHGGGIALRSVLSLSVMVDHDLVDGAPAARFAERLQGLIESADGLTRSEPAASAHVAAPASAPAAVVSTAPRAS